MRTAWWVVLAGVAWSGVARADGPAGDAAEQRELRRSWLQAEYQGLEDTRRETLDTRMMSEGKFFTLSYTIFRHAAGDDLGAAHRRLVESVAGRLPGGKARGDDVLADLPPLHVALGEDGGKVQFQFGAVSTTLGTGSLVAGYENTSRPGFRLDTPGLLVGLRATGAGATLMTSDVGRPGRVTALHVSGRPLAWLLAQGQNFKPEDDSGHSGTSLIFNLIDVGITAAVDTEDPRRLTDRSKAPAPRSAGGLSLEGRVGFSHDVLETRAFLAGTVLGRQLPVNATTGRSAGQRVGMGLDAGLGGKLDLPLLAVESQGRYRLMGPEYIPSYFDAAYETERENPGPDARVAQHPSTRHGFQATAAAHLLRSLGGFAELSHTAAVDRPWDARGGSVRVGAMLEAPGLVNLMAAYAHRGFDGFDRAWRPSPHSMFLLQQRLSLACFSLVARQWRTFESVDGHLQPRDGQSLLGQVQFGL